MTTSFIHKFRLGRDGSDTLVAYVLEDEASYWGKQITNIMKHVPLKDLAWVRGS